MVRLRLLPRLLHGSVTAGKIEQLLVLQGDGLLCDPCKEITVVGYDDDGLLIHRLL